MQTDTKTNWYQLDDIWAVSEFGSEISARWYLKHMDPGNDTENKYLLDDIHDDTDSKFRTQKKYQLDDMEYVGTKHRIRKRNTSKTIYKDSVLAISAYQQADTNELFPEYQRTSKMV